MSNATRRFGRTHAMVAFVTAVMAVLGVGRVASAHTDFESSVPSDAAVVEGPLTEVVVNFTNPAQPAGAGFELLDPTGVVRAPTSLDETDGTSFVLSFDPPLGAGVHGVRWSVRAGDAHPIAGSFQFEVTTPASTTTTPTAPAVVAPTTPATTIAEVTPSTVASPETESGAGSTSLDEFLETGTTGDDSIPVGRAGRMISMLGLIFGVGVLAALVWTVRGTRDELVSLVTWVRLAGLVVFVGGLIELGALVEADSTASLTALASTKPGVAAVVKMVGGLAVVLGFPERAGRFVAPTPSLSAAAATDLASQTQPPTGTNSNQRQDEHRWSPTSAAALGLFGYALVLVSFWFDGHTVSKGPWVLHSVVNLVHVGAGAVWGGGVFAMTAIVWMRRRSGRLGLAAMVVRFSSIATVSLVAVTGAGLVMAWMILDAPADLFATDWGRVLVAKTAVVAVAAGLGAFNHFRLRPALEQRPDDPRLAKELRVSLSIESTAFVAIVVLTAVLVASAT